MSQRLFMLKRKTAILTSNAVSSIEISRQRALLANTIQFVPCEDCEGFNLKTEYCDTYKMTVDPYIQMYGCGKGQTSIPF